MQRARHREDRRAGVAGRARDDADDAAPVLVALAGRPGEQRRHVRVLERLQPRFGGGEFEADVDEAERARVRAGRVDEQAGLVRSEGDGRVRPHRFAAHLAGVGVHAAREVDGHDGSPCGVGQFGRAGAQAALAADAHDAVDDEVGAAHAFRGVLVLRVEDRAARRAQRREASGVGPVGVQQQCRDARAPAGEAGARVQGVAAVVPRADEEGDAGAVHLAEQIGAGGRETGRRALHQRALGQPRHEGALGGPDRLYVVSESHAIECLAGPPPRLK